MTSLAAGNRLWDTSSSQTKRKSQCYTASQRLWNADWLWDYFYKYNLLREILFQQAVPCILARYSKCDSAVHGLSVIAPCAFPSIYLWISLCQPLKKEHRKSSAKNYLNKVLCLWMQFKGKMRSQPAFPGLLFHALTLGLLRWEDLWVAKLCLLSGDFAFVHV